jgi:UDP-N-acetylglucosamine:LPS N-acetylglucosamine transferase
MVDNDNAPQLLVLQVTALLDDDDRRRTMATASRALAQPDAAARLAGVLLDVVG